MSGLKPYLFSLAAGLLVGVVYSLLKVRSPAPPVIALAGLLGILAGEQIIPLARRLQAGELTVAVLKAQCGQHMFGQLPGQPPARPSRRPCDPAT